jgi:hypothetical protein
MYSIFLHYRNLKNIQTYDFIVELNKAFKFDSSLIPLLILLLILKNKNKKITVKLLMAELPFSEMGIRYHLRKLILKKILILKEDTNDRRIKIISTTLNFSIMISKLKMKNQE